MISKTTREVLGPISHLSDEWEQTLVRWSNLNSGSHHVAGLQNMAEALVSAFKVLPCTLVRHPMGEPAKGPALQFTCRPDAPFRILLSGHYDTVFEENHAFQTCEFTSARMLTGPGVTDMKGGLVTLLASLTLLERHPAAQAIGWEVILNPDEETGSYASRGLLKALAPRSQLALVFEPSPSGADIVRTRLGTVVIEITATGTAAHGSQALTHGKNAIVALSLLIVSAHELNRSLKDVILNVGKVEGGGEVNVVPAHAKVELHARVPSRESADRLLARLGALCTGIQAATGVHFKMDGGVNRPPKPVHPGEGVFISHLQTCANELDQKVGLRDVASASDANFLADAGIPVIDGLGVDGDSIHSSREYMLRDSLPKRIQLVTAFLCSLAEQEANRLSTLP